MMRVSTAMFQPLGRALMLPIAVLPVAGLLLRLGQPDLLNLPFVAQAGAAIFDNLGALFALGIMSGAIFFHTIGPIGIDPYGDGGQLFKEAIFTWCMGALVAYAHRQEIFAAASRFGLPVPAPRIG